MKTGKKYVNFFRITSEKIRNYSDRTVNPNSSHADFEMNHLVISYSIF
jgi:hypothetical protein